MASYLDEFLNKPRNPQASGDIFSGLYNPEQIADLESQYTNEYGIKNTSGGIASDARHMAAMNNLSNSLSPMNNGIGNFIGDTGAFLAGGLNEIGALGRGFNKENFAEIGEDIAANFRGSFGTPNSTTAEDIYSQVFTGAVPQRVASSNNQAYGAAQASELTDLERDFPGMSTGDIIDSMNARQSANRFSGMGQSGPVKSNMNAPAIDRSNVMGEDIDAQYTNDSFQTQPSTRFRDHSNMKSYLQANPDMGKNIKNKIGSVFNQGKQGILNNPLVKGAGMAFNAATGNIPGLIMGGIGMLGNQFADKTLYGDTIDENGNVYSADQLNSQNALGGGYTDPARSARRRMSRINNMKAREAAGKRISRKNLERLQAQEAAAQQSRLAATRSMARDNSKDNTGGYQAGYSGSFMGGSGTAADMGSFRDGGLASMFTRRR
jgi:hypothetical protein